MRIGAARPKLIIHEKGDSMDRSIPLLLIGLVFGAGLGFTYAAGNGITLDGHDHSDPAHHGAHGAAENAHEGHGAHDHGAHDDVLVIAAGDTAPTLETRITPDPASGWNLHIVTRNFTFSPERASRAHVPGEGHAHVYVNGVKLGRYYGPWVHLSDLPAGETEVKVTLNANDHRLLAVGDRVLEAVQLVTVPQE